MSTLKCKMCGGNLEVATGSSVVTCEYCGTSQTISKSRDEIVSNLYNRANDLRLKCEFDRAEQIYEKILQQDNTEAEAHWGIVLCRYGIEYVEDPITKKRIPTCHRTSYESIVSDTDYISAIKNADDYQKAIYEAEAKTIDTIQKDILAIAKTEAPFDIFICYKETDSNGQRTPDSVIANDIYYQLTEQGFKVFYAAISLEDKLGSAYEPCIFAALNSAKVMLSIGTRPEYFNAVWVKNEWSRFLKIIEKDRSKALIPCYRDMDAYELPEEFAHLQAQDMSKVSFINDIVRGISKIIGGKEEKTTENAVKSDSKVDALLDRAFIFLEDKDWDSANEYCEKALDIDPKNAKAYLGKLLVDLKVQHREDLKELEESFESNANYKKIIRFGDEEIKTEVSKYVSLIYERISSEVCAKAKVLIDKNDRSSIGKALKILCREAWSKEVRELKEKCINKLKSMQYRQDDDFKSTQEKYLIKHIQESTFCSCYPYDFALQANGTVKCLNDEDNSEYFNYYDWENIIMIVSGDNHIVGLKSDGTVVATGDNEFGQCDVEDWKDIVMVCADYTCTVGLKSDGTILTAGEAYRYFFIPEAIPEDWDIEELYGFCTKPEDWIDIVGIYTSFGGFLGLKSNGTVLCSGYLHSEVMGWENIIDISCSDQKCVGLKYDGTVVESYNYFSDKLSVESWKDIISIDVVSDYSNFHIVGLKSNGTVVATGNNEKNQCNVKNWHDIVMVCAVLGETVGLKSDGTVLSTKQDYGDEYAAWKNIKSVIPFLKYRVFGITANGMIKSVYSEGIKKTIPPFSVNTKKEFLEKYHEHIGRLNKNSENLKNIQNKHIIKNQQNPLTSGYYLTSIGTIATIPIHDNCFDLSNMTDLLMITVYDDNIAGLKYDGTVVGIEDYETNIKVDDWQNVVMIDSTLYHIVGLKADGTVLAAGHNEFGQCDVEDWKDIVMVCADYDCTVGLKSDGTVVAVGDNDKCSDAENWSNIVMIKISVSEIFGLKSDGTVVTTYENSKLPWENIVSICAGKSHIAGLDIDGAVMADGLNEHRECDVETWQNIVMIDAGNDHTVGLKADGTVLATGNNEFGQCDVEDWKDIIMIYCDEHCTIGLKSNGDVLCTTKNGTKKLSNVRLPIEADTLDEYRQKLRENLQKQKELRKQKELEEKKRQQEALERARQEQLRQEALRQEKERQKAQYRNANLCQHCGGTFKGLFSKTCTSCGKKKDY